ncbi:hypothetical protein CRENBAI_021145 [Crenichthys baileyi]|uniref:Uncharacterized protein n=1 Tax=Crenichthys baileyi TaxID=28760 RepID=A0AAV9R714_9TELE
MVYGWPGVMPYICLPEASAAFQSQIQLSFSVLGCSVLQIYHSRYSNNCALPARRNGKAKTPRNAIPPLPTGATGQTLMSTVPTTEPRTRSRPLLQAKHNLPATPVQAQDMLHRPTQPTASPSIYHGSESQEEGHHGTPRTGHPINSTPKPRRYPSIPATHTPAQQNPPHQAGQPGRPLHQSEATSQTTPHTAWPRPPQCLPSPWHRSQAIPRALKCQSKHQ